MNVRSLVLEISGVVILTRDDGTSCVATPERLREVAHWPVTVGSMWSPPFRNNAMSLIEEHTPGEVPGASWWVLHGNAEPDVQIDLTLEDGSSPTVYRLGNVWAVEWVSIPQKAFLYRSDRPEGSQPHRIRMIRPSYLPPAPYPDNHS